MKQVSVLFISWFLSAFSYKAMAQDETKIKDKKKSEEIVILKNGDKDVTMTIQISGDKVLINGKPISEFKDDNVSVNKRNVTVWEGDHLAMLDRLGQIDVQGFNWSHDGGSKVILGVTTEKGEGGAVINEITKESAAEKAGLQKGDIITKFGDDKIEDPQQLYDAVNKKKANDAVKIEFLREGKTKTVTATIQERKERSFGMTTPDGYYKSYSMPRVKATPKVKGKIQAEADAHDFSDYRDFAYSFAGRPKLGLKIQDTEEENGVKVLSVEENSASAKAGMKADDVVTEIGGEKVMNTDDAREALMENAEKSSYKIKAKRGGKEMTFEIKIPKKLKTANL